MKYCVIIIGLCFLGACSVIPKDTTPSAQTKRIETGMGPEDMVLDELSESPRLLISCNDHRQQEKAPMGNIYQVDLMGNSLKSSVLPRVQEPAGLIFHPHGIDLLKDDEGKVCLFVISHDDFMNRHFVLKYQVFEDSLLFLAAYEHKLMHSPNAVVAKTDGGFYISNDHGKRGNNLELILKQKKGNIVYCDSDTNWVTVADKLIFPNGLSIAKEKHSQYLYVATTIHNHVFRYEMDKDGNLLEREKVSKLVGGDNMRQYNDLLLVPGHLRTLAFVRHFKDPNKPSPSVVYAVDRKGKQQHVLYSNKKGDQIGAASTAVIYKDHMYISQVFQPFILQVQLSPKTKSLLSQ
ncbi:MAG: hypothetical protein GY810_25815 [Aureispira sp.]|nr:hypothetical protein [Aureispira sp.]